MVLQSIDASSITVSNGREGYRDPRMPPCPVIILNFPPAVALALVQGILRPHATTRHVFAGHYRHDDGKMKLGCYLVVIVPQQTKSALTYVIGNERDFDGDESKLWFERLGEFGEFAVSCGIYPHEAKRVRLFEPAWCIKASTFYRDDIKPMVMKAMFGR